MNKGSSLHGSVHAACERVRVPASRRRTPRRGILGRALGLLVAWSVSGVATGDTEMNELEAWLANHAQSRWTGESELWIDPLGNEGLTSAATMSIEGGGVTYTWLYEGAGKQGELLWDGETLTWKDSWHQPEPVALSPALGHGSLVAAEYSYAAGSGPDWHWRIKLVERPDATVVLQMTNIAPWGEEARAVRMTLHRTD